MHVDRQRSVDVYESWLLKDTTVVLGVVLRACYCNWAQALQDLTCYSKTSRNYHEFVGFLVIELEKVILLVVEVYSQFIDVEKELHLGLGVQNEIF